MVTNLVRGGRLLARPRFGVPALCFPGGVTQPVGETPVPIEHLRALFGDETQGRVLRAGATADLTGEHPWLRPEELNGGSAQRRWFSFGIITGIGRVETIGTKNGESADVGLHGKVKLSRGA
jgi:hypothetical protein